jgi:hypothetical protein
MYSVQYIRRSQDKQTTAGIGIQEDFNSGISLQYNNVRVEPAGTTQEKQGGKNNLTRD